MKRSIIIFLAIGWILFGLSLVSGYYFNKLSTNSTNSFFVPVAWEDHLQLFDGIIQCNLNDEDLIERKRILKEEIFSKVLKKEKTLNGFIYYFSDEEFLLNRLFEFVQKEKTCCPFFKFDISILPFKKGIAVQISGSNEAYELLKNFEFNSY